MRELTLAVVMLTAGLAGCVGDASQDADPASTDDGDDLTTTWSTSENALPPPLAPRLVDGIP